MATPMKTQRSNLSICSLNIDGIKSKDCNKLTDNNFLSSIKNYDIFGLLETRCIEPFSSPISDFKCHGKGSPYQLV